MSYYHMETWLFQLTLAVDKSFMLNLQVWARKGKKRTADIPFLFPCALQIEVIFFQFQVSGKMELDLACLILP